MHSLSTTLLSSFTDSRRVPEGDLSVPGFDDAYDSDTLFFDAVAAPDGRSVILLGPPPMNVPILHAIHDGAGHSLPFHVKAMDRHQQIWVDARGAKSLTIETAAGLVTTPVSVPSDVLAGRRVLLTLSRDNPLAWIGDWVRFNRDVHGADAVLVYDNGSSIYDAPTLQRVLELIPGIEAAVVVPWPFRYGPSSLGLGYVYDYCQLGALEHARWSYLAGAKSVLNSDIDELIISRISASVFDSVERSMFGVGRFPGRWVVDVGDATGAAIRHRDFSTLRALDRKGPWHRRMDANGCESKWAVVPRRCPWRAQWGVHTIKRWPVSRISSSVFSLRHFRPISTGWRYDRTSGAVFDPRLHERDSVLAATFATVRWDD